MRSRRGGVALGMFIVGAFLVVAVPSTLSWSDGTAGGTAQVPENLRECADGFSYCKTNLNMCGGCHGSSNDMKHPGASGIPVTDRIGGTLIVNGDADLWEYEPGASYVLDIGITMKNGFDDASQRPDARPPGYGEYSDGGFALNASAGTLSKASTADDTVRITGGTFEHYGSHHEEAAYDCPNDPPGTRDCRYGGGQDNEATNAGEAVNTYEGSMQRSWQVRLTAPASGHPHGVAFRLTVMVPNGDGIDSCAYEDCNAANGHSEPSEWDWWTHLIEDTRSPSTPEALILCEAGHFESRDDCREAVLAAVEPPRPKSGTMGSTNTTGTTQPVSGGSGGAGSGAGGGEEGSGEVPASGGDQDITASEEPSVPIPGTLTVVAFVSIAVAGLLGRRPR